MFFFVVFGGYLDVLMGRVTGECVLLWHTRVGLCGTTLLGRPHPIPVLGMFEKRLWILGALSTSLMGRVTGECVLLWHTRVGLCGTTPLGCPHPIPVLIGAVETRLCGSGASVPMPRVIW